MPFGMQRTVIDERYTILKPLGGGGMAKVFLAHDEVLGRDVALKVLREQYAEDEEFIERFRREARNAASLSHPNIVSVYDQGRSEEGGAYYMAMEYVPGGTLKERISRVGALEPNAAAEVALQIADALQAAHEKGVIHRDIKPQNVLITRNGDVKVTDFGIARAASSTTRMTDTGHVLGTAGYMSPEQAKGEPVGPQSDLYSLGVVLYEMLTGNLPYEAESALAQAIKHLNEPAPSPKEANPEVSEALDALTMKLLAKNPEERYPNARTLAEDLARALSGLPLAVEPGKTEAMTARLRPGKEPTRRTAARMPTAASVRAPRRGRLFSVLAALLFAALLLGGLAWVSQNLDVLGLLQDNSRNQSSAEQTVARVEVPDLAYISGEEAATRLDQAGLKFGKRYDVSNATFPAGLVIETNPRAGIEVEEGTVVDVVVSTGPQQAPAQSPVAPQAAPVQPAPVPPAVGQQQGKGEQKGNGKSG
jgi:tRNA A-37 threonylcarbamoyl transferase component Bud32